MQYSICHRLLSEKLGNILICYCKCSTLANAKKVSKGNSNLRMETLDLLQYLSEDITNLNYTVCAHWAACCKLGGHRQLVKSKCIHKKLLA